MSLSARSYSKESRSSSFYSRSSSYHASSSSNVNQLSSSLLTDIERPLSQRLIERDLSWSDWEDPFYFPRLRYRWDDPFWRYYFGLGRSIPVTYRTYERSSSARTIPVQYQAKLTHRPRRPTNRNDESSFIKLDESSISKFNRFRF
jgi:hypothetical protein